MPQRLPDRVDALRLAGEGRVLEGTVRLAGMRRLADLLAESDGTLHVALTFGIDEQGQPVVEGRIQGEVALICQRCLEPMAYAVDARVRLGLVETEAQAQGLSGELEPLLLEAPTVAIVDIVEDELILALPIVPRHGDDESCAGRAYLGGAAAATEGDDETTRKPFAGLAALKGHREDE